MKVWEHSRGWLLLGGAALLAGLLATWLRLPAAWLIGPLLAALALSLGPGQRSGVPPAAYLAAQAVVGVVLSASLTPSSMHFLVAEPLPVSAAVVLILLLSLAGGLGLARVGGLDAPTASLGTLPGGAAGMVAMSEALDADARVVAVMQYVRLILVICSISLVAMALRDGPAAGKQVITGVASNDRLDYPLTLLVTIVGADLGAHSRLPAGVMIGPLVLGTGLAAAGLFHAAWPPGLLQAAFALVGVRVGLLFDQAALRRLRMLAPAILGFTALLLLGSAVLGWLLALFTGMDKLTAYLATTPGGMDTATIAALSTGADSAQVLAVQLARMLLVVLVGPPLVRLLLRHAA